MRNSDVLMRISHFLIRLTMRSENMRKVGDQEIMRYISFQGAVEQNVLQIPKHPTKIILSMMKPQISILQIPQPILVDEVQE